MRLSPINRNARSPTAPWAPVSCWPRRCGGGVIRTISPANRSSLPVDRADSDSSWRANWPIEGARLTLVARDEEELQRAVEDLATRQPFAEVLPAPADVRVRYQAERAIAMAVERFGAVDVLINNAGIIQVGPLDHMKLADYEDAMLTHFWGPLYMTIAALPHMRREGAGRIVNISSIGGKIGVPHLVPYSASKFALAGLSEGLRAELARDNIVGDNGVPGSDANRLARQRDVQGTASAGVRVVCDLGFAAACEHHARARGAADHPRVPLRRRGARSSPSRPRWRCSRAPWRPSCSPTRWRSSIGCCRDRRCQMGMSRGRDGKTSRKLAGPPSPLTAPTYRAAEENNEM